MVELKYSGSFDALTRFCFLLNFWYLLSLLPAETLDLVNQAEESAAKRSVNLFLHCFFLNMYPYAQEAGSRFRAKYLA